MSHTNMINEKKKALLAYKEKIQDEIKYYEKAIDDFRVNYKNNSFYDDSDSSDSEDEFPFAVDTGPSVSELKLKQALLKTCLHATQELTSLTVLQSEVELLVEEPKIEGEPPITEPGTWKEVTAECNIDLVPFTITFYMHTPNYKFAPTSYRGLKVVPVKGSHELELSKSVLHSLRVPSDAVEVLRSYADGYRSRRTTLARLANKYANSLFMEPHPEGGFILKCAGLLEVSWRLENKWSPVAPFHHKMKFDLEYMEESYIKIITQAHKQLLDPAIQTDERTLLLAKIITTCLEARGPVEDSDLESKTTEKDIELEKRDSEVMAPPKSLPKKGKQKNKDNTSVKRSLVDDDKGATAKKAKHDEVATAKMAKIDEAPTARKAEVATAKKAKHDEVPTGKKAKTDEVATAKKAQSNEVTTSKKVKNDNQNDVAKKIQTDIAKTAKVSDVANEGSKKRKVIDVHKVAGAKNDGDDNIPDVANEGNKKRKVNNDVIKVASAKNDGDDQNIDDEPVKKRKVNDDKLASTKNSKESVTKESNAKTDSNKPKNNNTDSKNTNSNVKNNKNAKDSEKNEAAITKNKNIKTTVNNNDKNANTNDNKTKTTNTIAKNTENKAQDNAKPKNVKEINNTEAKTAKTNVKNKSPIDSANKNDRNNKMDIINDGKEVNSKTKTKNLKEQIDIDANLTTKAKNSKEIANTDLKSLKSKVNTQNVNPNTKKDHETKSKEVTKDKNNENEVKKNSKPKVERESLRTDKNQEINKNSDNVDKKKAKNVTDVKNKENLNVNRNTFTIASTENGENMSTNNLKDKTFTRIAEKVTKNDKNPKNNIEINEKLIKTDSKDKTSTKNAEKMSKTDKVSAKNIDKTAKNDVKHKYIDIQDKKTKNATQTKNDVQKITTVENKIEKPKSKQNPLQKSDKINSKTTKINNILTVTEKNATNFNTKDKISHINPIIKNKNILPTKSIKNSIASNKISKPSIASHRTSLKKSLSTGNTQVLTAGNTEAGKISKIPQKKFSPTSEGSSKKNMLRISPRINPSKFKMLSQDVKQKSIKTTNIPRLLKKPVGKV